MLNVADLALASLMILALGILAAGYEAYEIFKRNRD